MKHLLIIVLSLSILFGCDFAGRHLASDADDIKKVELQNYGFLNLKANFIPFFDRKGRMFAELNITLESIRTKLLATITMQGNSSSLPVQDFINLSNAADKDKDIVIIEQLKNEAAQLLKEAKGHYTIALEKVKIQEVLDKRIANQENKQSIAQQKFNIEKTILRHKNKVKEKILILNVVKANLGNSRKELPAFKRIVTAQKKLLRDYLDRENLYSDHIKDLIEYQVVLENKIAAQEEKITDKAISEMTQSISKCVVPNKISETTDCEKAIGEISIFIVFLEENIEELNGEFKKAEAQSRLTVSSNTQLNPEQEKKRKKIEEELAEHQKAMIHNKINTIKSEIADHQENIDTINAIIAAQANATIAMKQRINTLKRETEERIENLIFVRDNQVVKMREYAIRTLTDNKERETMLTKGLQHIQGTVQTIKDAIKTTNTQKIQIGDDIDVLNNEIKGFERQKRRL